ncbi:MAG: hypothetical protein RLZZ364_844 [Actinomycetota bacterium]|jgi:hypothetical protein
MLRKSFVTFHLLLAALSLGLNHASATNVATGANGATISISKSQFTKAAKIKVVGKGFDETVGIYLAYCVVPKKGDLPSPCGGGVNKAGTGEASYWISSNPPPYGVGLAIPFKAGGRFSEEVAVTRKIGKFDCRKVKCAITVRSDHLHEGDRTHDIYLPIVFK